MRLLILYQSYFVNTNMAQKADFVHHCDNEVSRQSQQLLATLTLQQLAHEEDPNFNQIQKINTVRQSRYNHGLNSWTEYGSQSNPKPHTGSILPPKVQRELKSRKNIRRIYQQTSTKLLQLNHSIEESKEKSKRHLMTKNRSKIRISQLNRLNDQTKLYVKRFRNERTYLSSQILPEHSFQQTLRHKNSKNKESSAIKKIKCGLIEKHQMQSESKLNICDFNKLSFSLQPSQLKTRQANCLSIPGQLVKSERKQCRKRSLAKTVYSSSMRSVKKESISSLKDEKNRKNPEIGLVFSQQFRILVNLLQRENANEAIKKHI